MSSRANCHLERYRLYQHSKKQVSQMGKGLDKSITTHCPLSLVNVSLSHAGLKPQQ